MTTKAANLNPKSEARKRCGEAIGHQKKEKDGTRRGSSYRVQKERWSSFHQKKNQKRKAFVSILEKQPL
jgi:hypothetical protein